ncbi:MAG: hypothetical protein LBU27_01495 [Candidatus Peribacteria bacterium]|nr:hypothetical protein [Candidatus Peribacteria bacterium]
MERELPPPHQEEVGIVGVVVGGTTGGLTGGTIVGSGRMLKSPFTHTPP